MKQDINTILANLAVTIAEKEEDIKRLTERVKEQETVVLRGEDVRKNFEKMMFHQAQRHPELREKKDDRSPAELRSDIRFMSEDMNELREKYSQVMAECEQFKIDLLTKDAELLQVKEWNAVLAKNNAELKETYEKKLAEKHKTFDADAITEYFKSMERICDDCPFCRRCEIAQAEGGLCGLMEDDSGEYVKLKLKEKGQ